MINTVFVDQTDRDFTDMEKLTELFAKAFGHFELLEAVITLASAAREVLSILEIGAFVPKIMQNNLEKALKNLGWA